MAGSYPLPPPRPKTANDDDADYYNQLAEQIEIEEGLPTGLLRAVIGQESNYRRRAVSPKGAMGLGPCTST